MNTFVTFRRLEPQMQQLNYSNMEIYNRNQSDLLAYEKLVILGIDRKRADSLPIEVKVILMAAEVTQPSVPPSSFKRPTPTTAMPNSRYCKAISLLFL